MKRLLDGLGSARLACALLVLLALLTWLGTLAQVELGLHAAQKRYFESFLLVHWLGPIPVPLPGANLVSAYDPTNGQEVWRVRYEGGYSVVPRPVLAHGLIFVSTGYDTPELLAIRTGGKGEVTDSHVAWTSKKSVPRNAPGWPRR